MAQLFQNNYTDTLAAALPIGGTEMEFSRSDLVEVPEGDYILLTLETAGRDAWEIVKVTAHEEGSHFATIERGQEGTEPRAWQDGDVVEARLTAGTMKNVGNTRKRPYKHVLIKESVADFPDPSEGRGHSFRISLVPGGNSIYPYKARIFYEELLPVYTRTFTTSLTNVTSTGYIAYSPLLNKLVGVSRGTSTTGKIFTINIDSPNGIIATVVNLGVNDTGSGIIYTGARFVRWGTNPSLVYNSTDGSTWTKSTIDGTIGNFEYIKKCIARNKVWLLSSDTFVVSSDLQGTTFSNASPSLNGGYSIGYSPEQDRLIVGHTSGRIYINNANDANDVFTRYNLTGENIASSSSTLTSICWAPGFGCWYVSNGTYLASSPDASSADSWSPVQAPPITVKDMFWIDELQTLVFVGNSGYSLLNANGRWLHFDQTSMIDIIWIPPLKSLAIMNGANYRTIKFHKLSDPLFPINITIGRVSQDSPIGGTSSFGDLLSVHGIDENSEATIIDDRLLIDREEVVTCGRYEDRAYGDIGVSGACLIEWLEGEE